MVYVVRMCQKRLKTYFIAGLILVMILWSVTELAKLFYTNHSRVLRRSVYNEDALNDAYFRSAAAHYKGVFVGDLPLFPPCTSEASKSPPVGVQYGYLGPFDYINNSKNPCWYGNATTLRCVPYFFLAGVTKSGTTDLYFRLTLHPDVIGTIKEPKWFSLTRYSNTTFDAYTAIFNKVIPFIENDLKAFGKGNHIVGDASAPYFFYSFQWPSFLGNENCTEPRLTIASQIRHLFPEAKIIFIIRHPVSRFLYMYNAVKGKALPKIPSPEVFHDCVLDALSKYKDCFARWSLRHCIYNFTLWKRTYKIGFQEGMYPEILEDWLRIFPRDQILFLRYEDYTKDIKGHLQQVFDFLKLGKLSNEAMANISKASVKNIGLHYNVGPMLSTTKQILEEFYEPFIRRLPSVIGDDRFMWADLNNYNNSSTLTKNQTIYNNNQTFQLS